MSVSQQNQVQIPNFVPRGTSISLFYVIDKDWFNKDRGFGPFPTMEEASRFAVEYNDAISRDSHKVEFSPRIVHVHPRYGRQKAEKVKKGKKGKEVPPRHEPVGVYDETGGW